MSNQVTNEFAGKHILVVDDVETVNDFLVAILKREGYRVSSLRNGGEVLDFVLGSDVDLILLDILMEGIDGFEVCRRLKAEEVTNQIPVIFVTAKNDPCDVVEGFKAGAVDFVVKPIRQEDVCARVKTQLKVREFILAQQAQIIQAEKLASLAELMGEFSHELETPIGIILTAQTHMEQKLKLFREFMDSNKLTKSKLVNFIDIVEDSTKLTIANIHRAIERTNSFKRLSVDQCSEKQRKFQLKAYLHDIETALRSKFINTDHQIVINCDVDIAIDSFPGALSQVVINLINNSLIHGFEDKSEGTIEISVTTEDTFIIIRYTDDGKGIPEDKLPKIFSQYYTSKPHAGGTGLGLYLVKGIIEKKLSGTFTFDSKVGEGVEFILRLPRGYIPIES